MNGNVDARRLERRQTHSVGENAARACIRCDPFAAEQRIARRHIKGKRKDAFFVGRRTVRQRRHRREILVIQTNRRRPIVVLGDLNAGARVKQRLLLCIGHIEKFGNGIEHLRALDRLADHGGDLGKRRAQIHLQIADGAVALRSARAGRLHVDCLRIVGGDMAQIRSVLLAGLALQIFLVEDADRVDTHAAFFHTPRRGNRCVGRRQCGMVVVMLPAVRAGAAVCKKHDDLMAVCSSGKDRLGLCERVVGVGRALRRQRSEHSVKFRLRAVGADQSALRRPVAGKNIGIKKVFVRTFRRALRLGRGKLHHGDAVRRAVLPRVAGD